jgi:uncharacterized membrane protein YfcA
MTENWLAFPAGLLIASASTSVGIGGGVLWMPFFLIILKMRPEIAVMTSFTIQSVGMGSASIAYLRTHQVDSSLATLLLILTVPGIAIGVYLGTQFSTGHFTLLLGLLTLATAFLFVSANQRYEDTGKYRLELKRIKTQAPLVTMMAVASGMLSVSIGEWLVPLMRSRWSLKMSTSVATSITVIFGTCIVGTLFHLIAGHQIDAFTACWAIPGVLIGGQIGPRIMVKVNERMLKEIFIFLLTLIGIHLIYNSY